jgi:signal transduction histidine kinase
VEVALRRERPPEEYQRVLALVQQQVSHLRQIVEMLLFLARADAEAKLPGAEPIDLAAWLPEHLRSWTEHPRAADFRLDLAAETPLLVHAQAALLGQLVDNLLDNACKYSRPGTPIQLWLTQESGEGVLAIEDVGCGIGEEDLPHIFEPFYRSARARGAGVNGVGLGLAVAQRIAVALGGSLFAESVEGKRSRFTLRFK